MAASVVVTSRLLNGRPDDGSCVRYVCSKYPLHVLSRHMRRLSLDCKPWAAGRSFLVTCYLVWLVLKNIIRQSSRIVVLTAGLYPTAVIVTGLTILLFFFFLFILLLIFTAIQLSLGGSCPYTSTDKTNKNKYT
jgi:hypothetical protein